MSLDTGTHTSRSGQERSAPSATPTATVNGQLFALKDLKPSINVLDWLRLAGFTGAKEGCAEGECGACAVMVARPDDTGEGTSWMAFNACLVPMASMDGQELLTSEGLGGPAQLHEVQQQMAQRGGSQCGYCTPGFVCSMASEYYRADRTPNDREDDVVDHAGQDMHQEGSSADHEHGPNGFDLHSMSGNLCRCTGYRPIRDAAYALGEPAADDPLALRREQPAPAPAETNIDGFVRPGTLAEVLQILQDQPEAYLVAGSTDWGVEMNLRHARKDQLVAIDRLPELRGLREVPGDASSNGSGESSYVEIGAALTLSEIERRLKGSIPVLGELFPQFASRLIRNGATLGGNLGTGSPIGDAPPALLALDTQLVLASVEGERSVALSEYFTGYRQTVKQPGELIKAVRIPTPVAPHSAFHKIAKRRFDDISSLAVAYALRLDDDGVVTDIKIGVGGAAATPLRANEAEQALIGQPWNADSVERAAEILGRVGTPMSDHRASSAYRSAMLRQSLRRFYNELDTTKTNTTNNFAASGETR